MVFCVEATDRRKWHPVAAELRTTWRDDPGHPARGRSARPRCGLVCDLVCTQRPLCLICEVYSPTWLSCSCASAWACGSRCSRRPCRRSAPCTSSSNGTTATAATTAPRIVARCTVDHAPEWRKRGTAASFRIPTYERQHIDNWTLILGATRKRGLSLHPQPGVRPRSCSQRSCSSDARCGHAVPSDTGAGAAPPIPIPGNGRHLVRYFESPVTIW